MFGLVFDAVTKKSYNRIIEDLVSWKRYPTFRPLLRCPTVNKREEREVP